MRRAIISIDLTVEVPDDTKLDDLSVETFASPIYLVDTHDLVNGNITQKRIAANYVAHETLGVKDDGDSNATE